MYFVSIIENVHDWHYIFISFKLDTGIVIRGYTGGIQRVYNGYTESIQVVYKRFTDSIQGV